MARAVEITACLNAFHELRGSPHRHGVREGWEWLHRQAVQDLLQKASML